MTSRTLRHPVGAEGHPTASVDDIALVLAGAVAGHTLVLRLQAPGGARSANVTLGELPAGT